MGINKHFCKACGEEKLGGKDNSSYLCLQILIGKQSKEQGDSNPFWEDNRTKNKTKYNMANKILIIGVGSTGIIAADKINLPNSKKLFIDTDLRTLIDVKSEGDKIGMVCKEREDCPMLYCHCLDRLEFCKKVAFDYEDEIRECIKNVFGDESINIGG